jgi:hypothetical protein
MRKWIAILGLALASPIYAQTQTGTIRVHVGVPATQTPIPGVQLSLSESTAPTDLLDLPDNEEDLLAYLLELAAARGIATNSQITVVRSGALASTVTDLDGNAVFENLKPGRYSVQATREGFGSTTSVANVDVASPVDVSLSLNPGASISGRVRTAGGAAVVNARVTLGTIQTVNGQKTFRFSDVVASTDVNGEYRLPPGRLPLIAPGEYALHVQLPERFAVIVYYPGTADIEKAGLISIAPSLSFVEALVNLVNIDIVMP